VHHHTLDVAEYESEWVGHPASELPVPGGCGVCQTSSFGDLNVAISLIRMNQASGGLVSFPFVRDVNIRDFGVDNFILLGGPAPILGFNCSNHF
jgi:hypothetical protein